MLHIYILKLLYMCVLHVVLSVSYEETIGQARRDALRPAGPIGTVSDRTAELRPLWSAFGLGSDP